MKCWVVNERCGALQGSDKQVKDTVELLFTYRDQRSAIINNSSIPLAHISLVIPPCRNVAQINE